VADIETASGNVLYICCVLYGDMFSLTGYYGISVANYWQSCCLHSTFHTFSRSKNNAWAIQ